MRSTLYGVKHVKLNKSHEEQVVTKSSTMISLKNSTKSAVIWQTKYDASVRKSNDLSEIDNNCSKRNKSKRHQHRNVWSAKVELRISLPNYNRVSVYVEY